MLYATPYACVCYDVCVQIKSLSFNACLDKPLCCIPLPDIVCHLALIYSISRIGTRLFNPAFLVPKLSLLVCIVAQEEHLARLLRQLL